MTLSGRGKGIAKRKTRRLHRRTTEEIVSDRGGIVRLEICTMKSVLMPRWWEVGRRLRFWRLQQQVRNDRKKLDPETQMALAWAEEALEREFLYGKDRW